MRNPVLLAVALLFTPLAFAAEGEGAPAPLDWQHWQAGNEVGNTASLQRGARNFFGYCAGCHSLKYVRYSRLATDLRISTDQLKAEQAALDALKPGEDLVALQHAFDAADEAKSDDVK